MKNTGIILLAAGGSTRLGRPKQLLKFGDQLLINRMIEAARAADFTHVVVVLGAYQEKMQQVIEANDVHFAFNENWKAGMGGSIAAGITKLQNIDEHIEYALIMLVDQYLIESEMLNELKKEFEYSKQDLLASHYRNKKGVPAIFSKKLFPELVKMETQKGASGLIKTFYETEGNLSFGFLPAQHDIDTEEDYKIALKKLGFT